MRFIPHWRKMTWVIWIWAAIFAIWIASGIAGSSSDASNCGSLSQQACNDAQNVGTGIGVALIFILWMIGFFILGLIWLMTKGKKRDCPVCGHDVKKGQTICKSCGYDFKTGAQPAATGGVKYDTQTGEPVS